MKPPIKNQLENTPTIWIFASIPPLFAILYSYIFSPWDWGLMDDLTILNSGNNWVDRVFYYFSALLDFGRFSFFFTLYAGIFYSVFKDHPQLFYIFKAFEITLILIIWGVATYRITRSLFALTLLPAITLSFHYFYDAFFYLSSHEFIGLFFFGVALHFFISGLKPYLERETKNTIQISKWPWIWFLFGTVFMVCAFNSKETFVSTGFALGLSFIWLAISLRKVSVFNPIFIQGIILTICTVGFVIFLKKFIQSGYTASYDLFQFSKIIGNILAWFKKSFLNHTPWILIAGLVYLYVRHKRGTHSKTHAEKSLQTWGLLLASLLYLGFLAILLPWNTQSYYAAPLGLFFAFFVSIAISPWFEKIQRQYHLLIVTFSMCLNLLVCSYALSREATYQYDTRSLLIWLHKQLPLLPTQFHIQSNAAEASVALPMFMEKKWTDSLERFQWTVTPNQSAQLGKVNLFIYGSRFHSLNETELKDWKLVFYSKNWIVYQK